MENLQSPLTEREYKKIEIYMQNFNVRPAETIEEFRILNDRFFDYLDELSFEEQKKAWLYLMDVSKKPRQQLKITKTKTTPKAPLSPNAVANLIVGGGIVIIILFFLVMCKSSNSHLMNAEFKSMDSCLSSIERATGKRLNIIQDKLGNISGYIGDTKLDFQCKTEMTGSKGIIVKGWYEVAD